MLELMDDTLATMIKVIASGDLYVELSDKASTVLLRAFDGPLDPRVSGCVTCHSCVVACEPFTDLLDDLAVSYPDISDEIRQLVDLAEESELVHLYIWEDNTCVHVLWRDPLAVEWSEMTGENRLHH